MRIIVNFLCKVMMVVLLLRYFLAMFRQNTYVMPLVALDKTRELKKCNSCQGSSNLLWTAYQLNIITSAITRNVDELKICFISLRQTLHKISCSY